MAGGDDIRLTDGTAQDERIPDAFAEGYIGIDEMSFADLLRLGAAFAKNLRYYDPSRSRDERGNPDIQGARSGDWGDLFANDDAVVMARILAEDVEGVRRQFERHIESGPLLAAGPLRMLAREIDSWLKTLARSDNPPANNLSGRIRDVIEQQLAWDFHRVCGRAGLQADGYRFDRAWTVGKPGEDVPGGGPLDRNTLRPAVDSFIHAIAYLQSITPPYLEQSLESQTHDPGIGLFIAFLRLMPLAQGKMNALTRRHLDFYYHQLLGDKARSAAPDSAYLTFRAGAEAGARGVLVARGTRFSAGRDAGGTERFYVAQRDLVVTDATIVSLRTLFFESNASASPERELNFVTRAQVSGPPPRRKADPEAGAWTLFGADAGRTGTVPIEDASIGFALASPAFLLQEGFRSVEIVFSVFDPVDHDERVALLLDGLKAGGTTPGSPLTDQEALAVLGEVFMRYLRLGHDRKSTRVMPDISDRARRVVQAAGLTAPAEVVGELASWGRHDLVYDLFLFSLARQTGEETEFYDAFGRLFTRYLLTEEAEGRSAQAPDLLSTVGIRRSPHVLIEEVLRPSSLIAMLKADAPAATYISSQLGTAQKRQLDQVTPSIRPGSGLIDAVVGVINLAIGRADLHVQDGFAAMTSEGGVGRLLAPDLAREDQPGRSELVNRILIERAFPDVFAPSWQAAILEKAARICRSDISLEQIRMLVAQDRHLSFFRLLRRTFSISMSTGEGWRAVDDYSLTLPEGAGDDRRFGLKCAFTLGPEVEPIVGCTEGRQPEFEHTDLPVIRFLLNPHANMYAYSMFHEMEFREVVVKTDVREAKDLVAYNNYGQIDPSKPFGPFGALPMVGSHFIFGNYEAAAKNLTSLTLDIEWGDLPAGLGGFDSRYEGYDTAFTNDTFRADVSVFRDGRWIGVADDSATASFPLFSTLAGSRGVDPGKRIDVGPLDQVRPISPGIAKDQFNYDLKARDGFFKIALVSPEAAFGHREYPTILTRVVSANARRKRPHPVPREPYTPTVNRLWFDYTARHVITPGGEPGSSSSRLSEAILHIHPCGLEVVHPAGKGKRSSVLPHYPYTGNLFIGLEAGRLEGPVTLFFHLREDSTHEISNATPDIAWFYLSGNRWESLDPSRVLSDTTSGFLSSGIVKLDLPAAITEGNTVMPPDLHWLRLSSRGDLRSFCTAYDVLTHAVLVSREDRDDDTSRGELLEAGRIRQAAASIPGLDEVRQPGPTFGGRLPEDTDMVKARVSERLRHKNRAWTAWDYERLILEKFPGVAKVKCFPAMNSREFGDHGQSGGDHGDRPGHLIVVVVPRVARNAQELSRPAMVSAVELKRIHDFISGVSSPFATIEVRNPAYERIQVRCKVKFLDVSVGGLQINRLNSDLVRFISPWNLDDGYLARFGWSIRREDIESFVRDRSYVEYVTDFSMLRIAEEDDGDFSLGDTARFWLLDPFSLASPSRFIQALKDAATPFRAYLKAHLYADTRQALDRFDEGDVPSGSLVTGLISDINELILSHSMYDESRIEGTRLREETARLIREGPSEEDLVLLNRLLVEDAMGDMVSRIPFGEDEVRPLHPWSLAIPVETHYIESVDYVRPIHEEPTGIDELEIGSTFIIS